MKNCEPFIQHMYNLKIPALTFVLTLQLPFERL